MTALGARLRLWGCVLGLCAMALYSILRLETHQSITHFLPHGMFARQAELARAISDSQLSRSMILLIEADTWDRAAAGAADLAEALRADRQFQWVYEGPDEAFETAAYDAFFARRMLFLSDEPETEIPDLISEDGLRGAASRLKRALAGPLGTNSSWLAADPLLAFTDHLQRMRRSQGEELEIYDGRFRLRGEAASVLFLRTVPDAFDTPRQRLVLARISDVFAQTREQHGDDLLLKRSGVNLFAVAGEESTRRDVARVSTLGVLLTIVLLIGVFRSARYVLLLPVPLGAGFLGGLTACLAIFGSVHGMTLAIGSALLGVTVDYCLHLFVHHTLRLDRDESPERTVVRTRRAILLGAGTTAAGFAGFGWTAIGGMREIAVFAVAGIATAVVVTQWVLPPLMAGAKATSAPLERLLGGLEATGLARWRRASAIAAAAALVACALGLSAVEWNDDPAALLRVDAALEAEDETVRNAVSAMDPGIFAVAAGSSTEHALQRNDRLYAELARARAAGELADFQSLHDLVWSQDLQRRNVAAVRADEGFYGRLDRVFAEQGFRPGAFAELQASLEESPLPLTPAALAPTPLASLVDSALIETADESLVLTRLEGVTRPDDLARRLEALEGIDLFDQPDFLARAFGVFRARSVQLLGLGLLVILVVVLVVYRGLRPALAAALPAPLAALTALAILALATGELNVMHVMGGCLVIAIVVDYCVFLVEGRRPGRRIGVAALSSAAACATTVATFGLLALSSIPALQSLGSMVCLGSALGLLFSPLGLWWLGGASSGNAGSHFLR